MVTALLIVIYIAFIGLGLPHSLLGAALPGIETELGVSSTALSSVTMVITGCTIVASMFGARLVNRYGTRAVVTTSAAMTAAALLGVFIFGKSVGNVCACYFFGIKFRCYRCGAQ